MFSFQSKNELQYYATHCCANVQLQATTHVGRCAVQLDARSQRARCDCHLAWRSVAKSGRDFVTIFGYQNKLHDDAACCCAYVQLQATTHVVWRAVRLDTRGQRARCEFHLA